MLQARVPQLWPAGRQHRWARLVYDQVGPTSALPVQNMRGNGQHEYGHGVQRSPLHSEGVRPSSEPARPSSERSCAVTRRNNRVVRVERRVKISTARRLKDALLESEDSENLNTSFVERLNLTMRQGSAYLRRRSPCHARCEDQLREHVELLRCHYNFVRPHRALKFGRETRTPAMQAGLVSKRLTLSDIFTARGVSLRLFVLVVLVSVTVHLTEPRAAELRSSWQPDRRTAA